MGQLVKKKRKSKWSRDKCRDRYVTGERIGIRSLAKLSGRCQSVLGRWCSQDDWTGQREQFQNALRTQIDSKTAEKTSDILSDDLSKRSEQHVRGYEAWRSLSLKYVAVVAEALQTGDVEKLKKQMAILDAYSMSAQRWSSIFNMAVTGERIGASMEYLDTDRAIARLVRDGFEVMEPLDEDEDSFT